MKIATWNVNGIRARGAQLQQWLVEESPDVVCLQEIKAVPAQVPELLFDPSVYWAYWHGGGGYSGVAMLVRRAIAPEEPRYLHPPFDFENRIVAASIAGAVVASVYVPNGGKDLGAKMRFLESLRQYSAETIGGGAPVILCGDINVAHKEMDVHPKERKSAAIGQLPTEREAFGRLLETGLTDVARALDPENAEMFTWWAPWRNMRQRNIGWRIDYLLASNQLASRARGCRVHAQTGTSDHAPVVAEFDWP